MNLFIGFLTFCFIGGLLAWRMSFRRRSLVLLILCLFLALAYYSLNQL